MMPRQSKGPRIAAQIASGMSETVIFERPIVGPKVYLSKSTSGWPETFERKKSDAALTAFLAPNKSEDVVKMFIASREIGESNTERTTSWFTIRGYLGRIRGIAHYLVPHAVAIAFWGQVEQAKLHRGIVDESDEN
jgi:hypothetical protein